MALRRVTEARITCANSIHEMKTLDGFLDDWDNIDELVQSAALDIHLYCDAGAKEAVTILDILTGFLTTGAAPEWLWMEAEIRQELAVDAADHIVALLEQVELACTNTELGLKEMKRRASMMRTKLGGLKGVIELLRAEIQREAPRPSQVES